MTPLRRLTDIFISARARVARFEATVQGIYEMVNETQHSVISIARENCRSSQTFVYVIPPDGPFYCQCVEVAKDSNRYLTFMSHRPESPGCWVVICGGRAKLRGVRIGNQMQSGMDDYQGQVCKTIDSWAPGTHLIVELTA